MAPSARTEQWGVSGAGLDQEDFLLQLVFFSTFDSLELPKIHQEQPNRQSWIAETLRTLPNTRFPCGSVPACAWASPAVPPVSGWQHNTYPGYPLHVPFAPELRIPRMCRDLIFIPHVSDDLLRRKINRYLSKSFIDMYHIQYIYELKYFF